MISFKFTAIACALALLSACASSPLDSSRAPRVSAGQTAVMALGTGAGAIAGHQIDAKSGAVIGAAVGLAGAAIGGNLYAKSREAEMQEYAEQRVRAERLRLMRQIWEEKTQGRQSGGASGGALGGAGREKVEYAPEVVEGVRLGPRSAESQELQEPARGP